MNGLGRVENYANEMGDQAVHDRERTPFDPRNRKTIPSILNKGKA